MGAGTDGLSTLRIAVQNSPKLWCTKPRHDLSFTLKIAVQRQKKVGGPAVKYRVPERVGQALRNFAKAI